MTTTTANDDPLNQPTETKNNISAAHETASNNDCRSRMPAITHERIIAHNIALAEHYKKWGIKVPESGQGGSLADVNGSYMLTH